MRNLTMSQLQRLRGLIRKTPALSGVEYALRPHHVEITGPRRLALPLETLARQVAPMPVDRWPAVVDEYFRRSVAAMPSAGTDDADAAPLTETKALTVGYLPSLSVGVLAAAQGLGYFADEKLDVKLEVIQSSQDANVLLSQGKFDVITGSMSAGFFNAIDRGLEVRVVGSPSTIGAVAGVTGAPPSGLYVRPDSEIETYADLKGKKIAVVGGEGSAVSYLVGLYAEAGGLTLRDVEQVTLGVADSLVGLEQGAVDAAYLTSPVSQQAESAGTAVPLGDAREIYGTETQSAFVMGPNLLKDDRPAGVAFMRALLARAADMQGDYRTKDDVVQAIASTFSIDAETVRTAPPYAVPADLAQKPGTAETMQQMFLDYGDILGFDAPMPLDEIVDDSLRQLAVGSS